MSAAAAVEADSEAGAPERDEGRGLRAAAPPRGNPRVGYVGIVLALGVLALGLTGVHDGLVATGLLTGSPWLEAAASASLLLRPGLLALAVAAVAALLGLWLLVAALRPGRVRGVPLRGESGAWLRHRDVGRLARGAAAEVDGVTAADASADRRRVRVTVQATSQDVRDAVTEAVSERLSALRSPPRVRVDVDSPRSGRSS